MYVLVAFLSRVNDSRYFFHRRLGEQNIVSMGSENNGRADALH